MEMGVVVHGPGIIDSGWAMEIINYLMKFGDVRCRLGGTMGRTAVIDAALENMIDISLKLLPSESLELFNTENVDLIFLLNYGKSQETGQVFGYTAFNHYFKKISNEDYLSTNYKSFYDSQIPVVQIERPGEEDGSIISWNVDLNRKIKQKKRGLFGRSKNDENSLSFDFEGLFNEVAEHFNLNKASPEDVLNSYFADLSLESDRESVETRLANEVDGASYTYRRIHGASPGENIFVNSFVIGISDSDSPILIARDGIIIDILGGHVKQHGVEKLGPVYLDNVVIKTGLLRKSDEVVPRILDSDKLAIKDIERNLYVEDANFEDSYKIAFVDHAAYDIYRFKNFDLVVTIGDDTTLVASDILYRFNIPIIGITDGDLDKVVENGFVNDNSFIIEVASGFDDIVGHNIFDRLFDSNQILEIPNEHEFDTVDEFKHVTHEIFKSHVVDVVKTVVPSFLERRGSDMGNHLVSGYEEYPKDVYIENEPSYDDNPGNEELYVNDFNQEPIFEERYVEKSVYDDDFVEESVYDEHYVEEPVYKDNLVENTPHEVYVEQKPVSDEIYVEHSVDSMPDEVFVGHDVPGEVFVGHEIIEDDYADDDFLDDFYAELPPESVEEVFVEPEHSNDVNNEESVYDEVYLDDVPLDDDVSSLTNLDVEESQFEMEFFSLDKEQEEASKNNQNEFDDDILYEKASFAESINEKDSDDAKNE